MSFFLQRNGADVTVTLDGKAVYGAEHRGLKERLIAAIQEDARHLTIRLHGVDFLDSDMLGQLVSIRKQARNVGGAVVLAGLNTGLHTLFDCTGLARLFTIIDSEPSAWQQGMEIPETSGEYARVDGRSAR